VGLKFGRSSSLFAHMKIKQLLISEEIDFLDMMILPDERTDNKWKTKSR